MIRTLCYHIGQRIYGYCVTCQKVTAHEIIDLHDNAVCVEH